jgi:hypothetical protein
MVAMALFCSGLVSAVLMASPGMTDGAEDPPKVERGTVPAPGVGDDGAKPGAAADADAERKQAEAMSKYADLRGKAKNTAEAQWKLALWCEQNGLEAESYVHLANVVRFDPGRLAAWKKLGFRKHNGHWMSEEQIQDEAEQKKADRVWEPLLAKLHRQVHDKDPKTAAEGEAGLAKIEDPRAVPAVFRELGTGGPIDQNLAIQVFGQVKAPLASKALAALAVYGASAEVRRRATESLKSREPAEFAEALIKLLSDPLKYEVRPVGGPGSPGILFVEGERFNVRRFYAPPPPPNIVFQPGDIIGYDQYGQQSISRVVTVVPGVPSFTVGGPASRQIPSGLSGALGPKASSALESAISNATGGSGGPPIDMTPTYVMQYSAAQSLLESQRASAVSQAQLQGDIKSIEQINKVRKAFNDRVAGVLKDATGQDAGETAKDWKAWFSRKKGYVQDTPKKPTIEQIVPSAYSPAFGQLAIVALPGKPDN